MAERIICRRHLLARRVRHRSDRLLVVLVEEVPLLTHRNRLLVILVEEVPLLTQRQARCHKARVEVVIYANDAHIAVVQPPRLVRLITLVRSVRATA